MTLRLLLSLTLCLPIFSKPTPLVPNQVVVVYNSTLPKSKELAEFYALNRLIPPSNLFGLEVPDNNEGHPGWRVKVAIEFGEAFPRGSLDDLFGSSSSYWQRL